MIRHPTQGDSPAAAANIDSEEARSLSSSVSDAALSSSSVISVSNSPRQQHQHQQFQGQQQQQQQQLLQQQQQPLHLHHQQQPVDFAWQEAGLNSRPVIFYGLSPLDDNSRSLQREAIISIAWIQPKSIGVKQWDLGSPRECDSLCNYIKQEPLFRVLNEPKYPRAFQLDQGGICWVPKGYLGVAVPLHDKDVEITLVSYREASSCTYTWPVNYKLYLTQSGFKADVRVKFVMVLLQPSREQLSVIHRLSQV